MLHLLRLRPRRGGLSLPSPTDCVPGHRGGDAGDGAGIAAVGRLDAGYPGGRARPGCKAAHPELGRHGHRRPQQRRQDARRVLPQVCGAPRRQGPSLLNGRLLGRQALIASVTRAPYLVGPPTVAWGNGGLPLGSREATDICACFGVRHARRMWLPESLWEARRQCWMWLWWSGDRRGGAATLCAGAPPPADRAPARGARPRAAWRARAGGAPCRGPAPSTSTAPRWPGTSPAPPPAPPTHTAKPASCPVPLFSGSLHPLCVPLCNSAGDSLLCIFVLVVREAARSKNTDPPTSSATLRSVDRLSHNCRAPRVAGSLAQWWCRTRRSNRRK